MEEPGATSMKQARWSQPTLPLIAARLSPCPLPCPPPPPPPPGNVALDNVAVTFSGASSPLRVVFGSLNGSMAVGDRWWLEADGEGAPRVG